MTKLYTVSLFISLLWRVIIRNSGLHDSKAGIKIVKRNTNNLRYADGNILTAESEEELNSLLIKLKEESEKSWLKAQIQKQRSWHLVPSLHGKHYRRGKSGNSDRFYFLGLQNHHGWWLQPWNEKTLLGRNDKPRLCTKKQRLTLLTEVQRVKAMVFPVAMYRCKNWTIKKAEGWRIDAFELWC